tara:strand:+ start:389 stop:577 length:189 start_codon:yes stop_codon:yes gene_type:complete
MQILAGLARQASDSRVRIRKGMPNIKKMREGQVIFCKIKEDIYQVIKVKNNLYRNKYEKAEF